MPENSARPLWSAAEVAAATGGVLHGDDRPITSLTYNSREIVPVSYTHLRAHET